eukprot:2210062-Amphidinium_carterae.3
MAIDSHQLRSVRSDWDNLQWQLPAHSTISNTVSFKRNCSFTSAAPGGHHLRPIQSRRRSAVVSAENKLGVTLHWNFLLSVHEVNE